MTCIGSSGPASREDDEALRRAPRALRDFFDNLQEPPWLDYQRFRPGIHAFHENVDLMLTAFVTGVLVEGFSTLIAKSFNITGRVANSSRRLQQNNRHMMEIFFPAGLQRSSEGWKLSMRIRFVHSRIRKLLAKSDEWEHETWGMPLSAAHLGFAISVFSKRLLEYSAMLGARFSKEEKDSVLAIWRYSGHVMGIPDTILYSDAEDTEKTYKISYLCEPPPDADSVAVANLLIQSIPKVANLPDPEEQEKLVSLAYRLSRSFIGTELADSFGFPPDRNFATLFMFRTKQRLARLLRTNQMVRLDNFTQLLPDIGIRRRGAELQTAGPRPHVEIETLVTIRQRPRSRSQMLAGTTLSRLNRYVVATVRHRWLVVGFIALLMLALTGGARFIALTSDSFVLFRHGNPQLFAFQALENTYSAIATAR